MKEVWKELVFIGLIISFFVFMLNRYAEQKQEADDKRLIESFSPMSDNKEIIEAYNRRIESKIITKNHE